MQVGPIRKIWVYDIRLRELVLTACHFFHFHLPGSFEVKSISVRIGEKFMRATVLIGRNMRSILRQLFSVCSTRVSWQPSLFGVFERVCTRIGVKAWGPRYSPADAFHTCQSRQDLPSSSLPSFRFVRASYMQRGLLPPFVHSSSSSSLLDCRPLQTQHHDYSFVGSFVRLSLSRSVNHPVSFASWTTARRLRVLRLLDRFEARCVALRIFAGLVVTEIAA